MQHKTLPPNWYWVKLCDLVQNAKNDIVDGPFGSNLKASEYLASGVPIIRLQNINRLQFVDKNIKYISKEKAEELKRHNFRPGDIVITKLGDPLGKACEVPNSFGKGIIVADVVRFRLTKDKIDKRFLLYTINSSYVSIQLKKKTKGTTRPRVNLNHIRAINVKLPPLSEQHRIVEKIEELFSELDNGIENLKKSKAQIKTYRQAVLKFAFEGRLTAEDSSQKSEARSKNGELPEGWELVDLGEVCEKVSSAKNLDPNSEFLYLDIGGIDNKINEIVTHKKYNWRDAPSRAKQIVLGGDILFSTVRTYLKNIALVPQRYSGQIASTGFCVIRPRKNILLSEYIFHLTLYEKFLEPLNALQTGSSYPAVRDKNVFSQKIPLPPLTQQTQIVEEIEKRFSVADKMEAAIDESLQKSEVLRQSILKQAFEGKLLKQTQEVPALKPFQKMQVIGAVIKVMEEYNYRKGEMIIAKFLYLVDKIYKLNLGIKYKPWHFGPYSPEVKKLLTSRSAYFRRTGRGDRTYYSLSKESQLFKYYNQKADAVKENLPILLETFSKYKNTKQRDKKIELLASVCKVVEDSGTADFAPIYEGLKNWNTEKEITGFSNKAEKFSEKEVGDVLAYIKQMGWTEILLNQSREAS